MMDNREIPWFKNAADRVENYYSKLGADRLATLILKYLSHVETYVREKEIVEFVCGQTVVDRDDTVLATLELLLDDNYLVRDTSSGERRYRFRYDIMRRWWRINKG